MQFSALIEYHSDFLIGDPFCGITMATGFSTSPIMAFVKSLGLTWGKCRIQERKNLNALFVIFSLRFLKSNVR